MTEKQQFFQQQIQKTNQNTTVGKETPKEVDFLVSYKYKFQQSLKFLSYYLIVLLVIFGIINFTDLFKNTTFSTNQLVLNKGLNEVTNKEKIKNSTLEGFIEQRYLNTLKRYENFFGSSPGNNIVSGYYCVDNDGVIRKIDTKDILSDLQKASSIGKNFNNKLPDEINRTTATILATVYGTCGRDANIFRIKFNDVYNGNILTDILSIKVTGSISDNLYKFYNYAYYYGYPDIKDKILETIKANYDDIYKQIEEKKDKDNLLLKETYSPENILLYSNTKIFTFNNQITDSKIWFDGNDELGFFSKLAWISSGLYDLAVFNIKGTLKYIFGTILYTLPFVNFIYLNITSFILSGILTVLLFFTLDMLPISMLALTNYFNLQEIIFYIEKLFYAFIYYFIDVIIAVYIINFIITFLINIF